MLVSDGKFDNSGVGLGYTTRRQTGKPIVKSCVTVMHPPVLSHALSSLRVRRNKHRFEGDLRSLGECTLPNHSIIFIEPL